MDGWFHVLAIGNSAPMNIGVHVRERASEPVAASREQSLAELRKDGLKSCSGCSTGQMEGRCVSAGCAEEEGLH